MVTDDAAATFGRGAPIKNGSERANTETHLLRRPYFFKGSKSRLIALQVLREAGVAFHTTSIPKKSRILDQYHWKV